MMTNFGSMISACCPKPVQALLYSIENSSLGSRLAEGILWSVVGTIVSRGLMLAATVIVARMLGKTGFGEFTMIQSTVGMLCVFAGFGLGLTATKHFAEFRYSDPELAVRIIGLSGLIAFVTGGLMDLGLFL